MFRKNSFKTFCKIEKICCENDILKINIILDFRYTDYG